jgi:ABC-type glutathione transport system ATPase component
MLDVNIESVSAYLGNSKIVILENIDFKIEAGFIYTILGKNGSGKSTLIKSLTNLLLKSNYEVTGKSVFNGTDMLTAGESEIAGIRHRNIRYVFQDTINSFDPLQKLDYYFNLFAPDKSAVDELMYYFLLPEYKKIRAHYPYELSGGMSQRLSLIFALLANPDLIILDEPTSGIDYAITNLVLLKLKEFVTNNKSSVLIVTQDIKFASIISNYIAMISEKTLTDFLPVDKFFSSELNTEHRSLLLHFQELK